MITKAMRVLTAMLLITSQPLAASANDSLAQTPHDLAAQNCRDEGGQIEGSKCILPHKNEQQATTDESECGLLCKAIIGLGTLAAARVVYCKANLDKC